MPYTLSLKGKMLFFQTFFLFWKRTEGTPNSVEQSDVAFLTQVHAEDFLHVCCLYQSPRSTDTPFWKLKQQLIIYWQYRVWVVLSIFVINCSQCLTPYPSRGKCFFFQTFFLFWKRTEGTPNSVEQSDVAFLTQVHAEDFLHVSQGQQPASFFTLIWAHLWAYSCLEYKQNLFLPIT